MSEAVKFINDCPAGEGDLVELYNGRVVDVERGCYYPEGTRLFIKDKKILALKGAAEEGGLKADYRMDLKGLTLIPGLINTHCHTTIVVPAVIMSFREALLLKKYSEKQIERGFADSLRHGVTTVREVLIEDIGINLEYSRRIEEGTLQGPRIYNSVHIGPEGGVFTEKKGVLKRILPVKRGNGIVSVSVTAGEQEIRDTVDRIIDETGVSTIKLYDQRYKRGTYKPGARIFTQEQLNAVADQCRKRGVSSTIHILSRESFKRAVEAGVTSIAHVPFDEPLDKVDIDRFLASDCYIEPTLSVGAYFVANLPGHKSFNHKKMLKMEELKGREYARLASRYWIDELQESVLNGYERLKAGRTRLFGLIDLNYMFKFISGVVSTGMDNMEAIIRAGGSDRVAAGTDAGASHTSIANMELEYLLLREFLGFDAVRTLKAATINSAGAIGMGDRLGSIEVGKIADLAIIEGDPINDSSCLGQPVRGLFKEGNLALAGAELELKGSPG